MTFSVIIPVYNVENFLDTCLKSVLGQTYREFEVLLIDDGSTDNSGIICDKWGESDHRIIVVHKPNGGLSDARNYGIRNANGEYVVFLDSDDYWHQNDVLQKIADRLLITNADLTITNYCKERNNQESGSYFNVGRSMSQGDAISFLSDNELFTANAWNKVVKTTLFQHHDLFFVTGITSEDIDWCARLVKVSRIIDYFNIVLVNYCYRSTSISHTTSYREIVQLKTNIINAKKVLDSCDNTEKKGLLESYLSYLVGVLLFNVSHVSDKEKKNILITETIPLLPFLEKSRSRKIKLINFIRKRMGLRLTIYLLGKKHVK